MTGDANEAKMDDAAVDNSSKEEYDKSGDASSFSLNPIAINTIKDALRLKLPPDITTPAMDPCVTG